MTQNIIVGLDLGSRAVRMAAGQVVFAGEKKQVHLLGAAEVPSGGIKKGAISNLEDMVSAISICRERLENLIGLAVEDIWVSLNTAAILCQPSRGLVGIARGNGEIDESDLLRAVEQAKTVVIPSNYEILHIISRSYSVDGGLKVKDPLGMTGIRLEVDTLLLEVASVHLKNLTKGIYRTALNINDVVLGILADAEAVLAERQRDLGSLIINIGAATTGIAVFEEDELLHVAVLPIGSDYITQDIALCLKIPLDLAETIKIKYGFADPRNVSKKDEIDLSPEGYQEIISRKYLAEIIEARVEQIFGKVNDELKKIGRLGLLPAGAWLCGGGAKLHGIIEVAKRELKLPAAPGYPLEISSISEKISDLSFSTVIGLVKWGSGFEEESRGAVLKFLNQVKRSFGAGLGMLKGGFQSIWK